ncbi:MAG TPA: Hsp70 family protein, partial [Terriglobales bacterium]|nr:Hsp70 family protein [Terriglobales bacterium]
YAWLQHHEKSWSDELADTKLVVVIDVGGGTTDFSLIAVTNDDGRIGLERMAVGDHLLLGGDNVDVALARQLEPRLGTKLDSQRWHALTNLCRSAKETLLGEDAPEDVTVRLMGRGGAVVGGTVSATLSRAEVQQLVIDGFFPLVDATAEPRRGQRAALQEWGLPFAAEAEVSRHLARFLSQRSGGGALPDAILFNGGALKPSVIRARLAELLARWRGGDAPKILTSDDLDLAVARGAAYYGLVRRGRGVRIAGGSPRAYYLGIGTRGTPSAEVIGSVEPEEVSAGEVHRPASPNDVPEGSERALKTVLCIAHRGMQEGEQVEVAEPPLALLANRAVAFPLYASSTRLGERAGQLIEAELDTLTELPPIRTVLRFGKKMQSRTLPVSVITQLTEVGTLELWCRSLSTDHRWRLQFQLRDQKPEVELDPTAIEHLAETVVAEETLEAAVEVLRRVFPPTAATSSSGGPLPAPAADPVTLMRQLESAMGTGKDAWPLTAIRRLWDVLWEGAEGRGISPAHEARWFNLCGHLLRPGFGAELDEFRIQQLWRMRSSRLRFPKAAQGRAEWWALWKRIAGGLSRQQQIQLHQEVAPFLLPKLRSKVKQLDGIRPGPQEIREFWQLMASCERLSAEMKAELGDVLLPNLARGRASDSDFWVIARLGARAPIYGPANCVVRRETATKWVEAILAAPWEKPAQVVFTLTQLARCVGDRERDLDEAVRQRVAELVKPLPAGDRAARLVTEVVSLAAPERARIMDEALPAGLQIRTIEL